MHTSQITNVYFAEHGSCPSKWARSDETRCSIAGPYDHTERLLYTHHRYIYGEIVVVKNGTIIYIVHPSSPPSFSLIPLPSRPKGVWMSKPHAEFYSGSCDQFASYDWLIPKSSSTQPAESYEKLLIFMTPATGGAFFQHFIDRGWSALMQMW